MKTRNDKQKASQTRGVVGAQKPVFAQLHGTAEWALDLAVRLAEGYDEDIEAIERVRSYLRGWIAGCLIDLDLNDLLTTLAILFAAIDVEHAREAAEDDELYCPGAGELERELERCRLRFAVEDVAPAVSIRRRYRNAAFPTQLAA